MLVYRSANYAIVSITYILNTLRLGHGPYEKHYDDHNGKVFFQYQVNYKQYVVFGRGKRRIEKNVCVRNHTHQLLRIKCIIPILLHFVVVWYEAISLIFSRVTSKHPSMDK